MEKALLIISSPETNNTLPINLIQKSKRAIIINEPSVQISYDTQQITIKI